MTFLLDANICIAFLNGREPRLRDQLLKRSPSEVALCSVVKAELLFGARNSGHEVANLRLREFFAPLESLPFDDSAASCYGKIRAQLKKEGRLIGSNDLMIAAIALAADVTLVTRNDSEFQRVPGIRLEIW